MLNWYHEKDIVYNKGLQDKLLVGMSRIDKLSKDSWHFYRDLLNDYEFDHNTNAINRAFYKLYEMLQKNPHLKEDLGETLHLAEAPGSFVQVVRKVNPQSKCTAISKSRNSYASILLNGNDIPIFHDLLLSDLNVKTAYLDLTKKADVLKLQKKYSFITSDGGIDEGKNYSKKEQVHYQLKLGEIVSILSSQKMHGNCILKIFDTFHETTIQLLYLLAKHYKNYSIFKPDTSRPTNSERYIICTDFQGAPDTIHLLNATLDSTFRLHTIPEDFRDVLLKENERLSLIQLDFINKVMDHVDSKIFLDYKERRKQKKEFFQVWLAESNLSNYIYHIKKFRGYRN